MFFRKRKEVPVELPSGLVETRDELNAEVRRWWYEIDAQIDVVLAQHQMTFLFPFGSPDCEATHADLQKKQIHLRNQVAEYDSARAKLHTFAMTHPEIHCPAWQDSHEAIRTMIRLKNKKR